MKQKITLLLSCLISTIAYSQSTNQVFLDWKTTDGTQNFFYKNITKTDGLGNVYVAGATVNGAGNTDILLAKYNSAGVQLWIQQYAGSGNGPDFAGGLAVTNTDVYVTGAVTTGTNLATDVITMHYSSAGVLQWTATYNGTGNYFDSGKFLVIDGSNNVYVTGGSYNASGNIDFVTIKYSSTGTQQWVNLYGYSAGLDDAGINIATSGSNVVVTGAVTSTTNNYKVATLTYAQSTGSLTATNVGTLTTTSSITAVTDLGKDVSGNIYIVGSTYVSGQNQNYYVQKLSNTLATIWTYTYNGSSNLDDIAKGIQLDASSNVYVTGYSTSSTQGRDITTVKLNSSGAQQWVQTINGTTNGDDEGADMIIDASANIYIAGYINSSTLNKADYYTVKYNSSGTKIWDIQTDGNHLNDQGTNITLDSLNNVIVTGQSETAPNVFQFLTTRCIQRDVITFTDLNSEPINPKSIYLPNKGQLLNTSLTNPTDILYYNLNNYPSSYIARNRLSFLQFHRDTIVSTTDSLERIDMVFNKCKTNIGVYTESVGTTYDYNYFVGTKTVSDVHGYTKIIAPEIYTGIDLHYYSNAYGVKAYFVIKPFADPRQIEILLQGQQSATITANNLKINGLLGSFNLRKPNVYNINGGTNVPITGAGWALSGSTVTINTATYTTSQPLVIEFSNTNENTFAGLSSAGPSDNLDWCTYVGDVANDGFQRMAVDKSNNKYMAGQSDGNNYPVTAGVFAGTNVGATALIITKFNHLNKHLHSTYYSGTMSGGGYPGSELKGLAVDSLQNIFFTGRTNCSDFPFPLTQPSGSYHYTTNLFTSGSYFMSYVVKLDSAMQHNLWGTHIGDNSYSCLNDVMVDKNQNVTVGGVCYSSGTTFNFPTPPTGAYYNTQGTGFLFRFNNNGVAQYATRTSNSVVRVAENKANGDYFIGTWLYSGDPGQKFKNPGGGAYYDNTVYLHDFYLARFNNQDSITWATVFGGTSQEFITDMAIKDSTLILAGYSDGINFPIKYAPGQYVDSIHSNTGQTDYDVAFVRFNSYTGKHIYSSYYGGEFVITSGGIPRDDKPTAVTIDNNGRYYISGNTSSDPASGFNLKYANGFYYSGTYYGNTSGFLLSYSANNDLRLSSYFGGRPYQGTSGYGGDITYMSDMEVCNGSLFVGGQTNANRYFPIYDGSGGVAYFDSVLTSPLSTQAYTDGFVASFNNLAFVGLHDLDKNKVFDDVFVYPNPSSGIFTIEMEGLMSDKMINFNVYNVMGQIVHKEDYKAHDSFISKQINLSALSEGIYFINIIQNNKSLTVKVIKQ
jgi:hypothetical protein